MKTLNNFKALILEQHNSNQLQISTNFIIKHLNFITEETEQLKAKLEAAEKVVDTVKHLINSGNWDVDGIEWEAVDEALKEYKETK